MPAGALRDKVPLALRGIPGWLPGAAGPAVEATPHGLVFDKPVALRFAPRPEELAPGIHFAELRVATLVAGRWEVLPTSFPAPGVVEGLTSHFSVFALLAPCHVSGTGLDFPLTGCPTFSPRIQTSAAVTLNATAGNVTLRLSLAASTAVSQVAVELSGFSPGATLYLHRDDVPGQTQLLADAAGAVGFVQDTSAQHLLVLSTTHGSLDLDSATCFRIGNWDDPTKTCTMTTDFVDPPIYVVQNGLTLDCMDPTTTQPHLIGGGLRPSTGIQVFGKSDVTIRNCVILQVDFGVVAQAATRLTVDRVAVAVSPQLDPGATAFDFEGSGGTFTNLVVSNFRTGFRSSSNDTTVRNANFKTQDPPILFEGSRALFEDVTLDGTLSGPGPVAPTPPQFPAAVALSNAHGVTVRGLIATQQGAFDSAVGALFGSSEVTIERATISGARRAIRLDGPAQATVTGSTLTGNDEGLAALGGAHLVFHNNLHGNSQWQVFSQDAVELSDTRPDAGSFGEGNYWGHGCPGALFVAGTDSNAANVVDSHPYGQASFWSDGGTPGCPPPTPVLVSPAEGAVLSTSTPTFTGTALAGVTVEVLEGGMVRGSAVASAAGEFAILPASLLAEGAHSVAVRATLGGATSAVSGVTHFTLDSVAPGIPGVTFPTPGATLNDTTVLVAGTAEPGVTVRLQEGASLLGGAVAEDGGTFLAPVQLAAGPHTLTVVAEDEVGNQSPPSSAVSFTIVLGSVGAPLVGKGGKLRVTSVTDSLDPFLPSLGETNTVHIEGEVDVASAPASTRSCVTIRRGEAGDVADARLRESTPATNYGWRDTWVTGDQFSKRLALVRYDLDVIPAGATVLTATAQLRALQNLGASTVEVHAVTAEWKESAVTWASFGSQYEAAVVTQFSNGGAGFKGFVTFDVTALTQSWLDGRVANHGVALRAATNTTWGASEQAQVANRPGLTVCYVDNRPPTYEVHLTREVTESSSSSLVASSTVSAPVTYSVFGAALRGLFSLDSRWDGQKQAGGLASAGTYSSKLTLLVLEKPPGLPGPVTIPPVPPECGPAAHPFGGPCGYDKRELLTTAGLFDRAPVIPPPREEPPQHCSKNVETCNGVDDNCNGQVDEGACGNEAYCHCD